MATLFLLVFILDLLASVTSSKIATCDVASCLEHFSLTGDKQQFCLGAQSALECAGDIKYNHKCSKHNRWQVGDIYHRLERMSDCVCSQGSTYTYSLQLSVGLAVLVHVVTSFK